MRGHTKLALSFCLLSLALLAAPVGQASAASTVALKSAFGIAYVNVEGDNGPDLVRVRQELSGELYVYDALDRQGEVAPDETVPVAQRCTRAEIGAHFGVKCPKRSFINMELKGGSDQATIDDGVEAEAWMHGGPNSDVLTGGSADDVLDGDAGNDTLKGTNGDDDLDGGSGVDTLLGGSGNDKLNTREVDQVNAETANCGPGSEDSITFDALDQFQGCEHGKTVVQKLGSSVLANAGPMQKNEFGLGQSQAQGKISIYDIDLDSDQLNARDIDVLNPSGTAPEDECVRHMEGNVSCPVPSMLVVNANDGDDVVQPLPAGLPASVSLIAVGGPGLDLLEGGDGKDWLIGGTGSDWLLPSEGDDTLFGGPQSDALFGGPGDDRLWGNGTNEQPSDEAGDALYGDAGNDVLRGGPGSDLVVGGTGNDVMMGFEGFDTLLADERELPNNPGSPEADTLDCGKDSDNYEADDLDTVALSCEHRLGSPSSAPVSANVSVATGKITLQAEPNAANKLEVTHEPALSKVRFSDAAGKVVAGSGCAQQGDEALCNANSQSVVSVHLGDRSDQMTSSLASTQRSTVYGDAGADHLSSSASKDAVYGGSGNDVITTGSGNDMVEGGPGSDFMDAGTGADSISYLEKTTPVDVFIDPDGAAGNGETTQSVDNPQGHGVGNLENDTIYNFESAFGGSGDDLIYGNPQANVLIGYAGRDLIFGGPGGDLIFGDGGTSGSGDLIRPGAGRDYVWGAQGADNVRAKDGEVDSLDCGPGIDTGEHDAGPSVFDTITACEF